MAYLVFFLGVCFVLGGLAVASNPSPYYGVVGLVLASVVGCGAGLVLFCSNFCMLRMFCFCLAQGFVDFLWLL
ncbi:NU6M oxidoreductase, partial [Alcedo cyanopectus]|nr:NU6M oxidoreductase [Ceyx cyanopectus]